jgi:hypothetical protein
VYKKANICLWVSRDNLNQANVEENVRDGVSKFENYGIETILDSSG